MTIVTRIDERANIRQLAAGVVLNAVETYCRSSDTWQRLEAICWLASRDFEVFADVAGLHITDGLKFLQVRHGRTRSIGAGSAAVVE